MENKRILLLIFFIFCLFAALNVSAADKEGKNKSLTKDTQYPLQGPIVEVNWKYHKIGTLWTRVLNNGKTGDDAYQGRTPSCDWPGGSGNSYLYRGSLWLTARVDGEIHSTQPESNEYAPIDSVHFLWNTSKAEYETYTKYYDVEAPLATGHFPLGLEITERTYSWSESFRDDFIIYEFVIKNVGIDTDGDGYPDTPRDLDEFYFTYRLDGDVSKLTDWAAEYRFSNQDDHAGVNSSWGILDLFPGWRDVAGDFLTDDKADSTLMFMWDGDNPSYPADNGEDDDSFNPGVDGKYQTPGFLGFRILKTIPPSFKPSAFHTNHIYNDPKTDQEAYDRMMAPKEFESDGPSGVLVNPQTGKPFPNDYRAVLSLGPLDKFKAGDSVVVYAALGVGADTARAGAYSLMELVKIMDVAKQIIDNDFTLQSSAAHAPNLEVKEILEDGATVGLKIRWDNSPEDSSAFIGYKVWKSKGKNSQGDFNWELMGSYFDTVGTSSWPPPVAEDDSNYYELTDMNIIKGFDYYYSVQSYSDDPIFGPSNTNRDQNRVDIMPSNLPTNDLSRVTVVPNPYIGSASWNNRRPGDQSPWKHRIQFTNIPRDATIKIFTVDLDFVDEIKAGDLAIKLEDFNAETNYGVAEWDLITRNDQEAAPGIYIYVVDSPTAGRKVGKFVIVR